MTGAAVGLAVWGAVIEPRCLLDVRPIVVALPRLPPAWAGRRIAVLADWQVGMWWANVGMVRRALRRVIAERPAALLLAGDFVYAGREDLTPQVALLEELVAPLAGSGIPAFAVLGNHDWALAGGARRDQARADTVQAALESGGVRVLRNEAVALRPPDDPAGRPLYVVGIGAHRAGEDHVARAFREVPAEAARLVFMHNPRSFLDVPVGAAPIAIAGHTHGGQIRLPLFSRWFWLVYKGRDRMPRAGWIRRRRDAGGNALYVNRGIGFSRWPVRINCPPELTLVTLQADSDADVGQPRTR